MAWGRYHVADATHLYQWQKERVDHHVLKLCRSLGVDGRKDEASDSNQLWIRDCAHVRFGTLGDLVCDRAGVLNLGIVGIMTLGAMTGWMSSFENFAEIAKAILGLIGGMAYLLGNVLGIQNDSNNQSCHAHVWLVGKYRSSAIRCRCIRAKIIDFGFRKRIWSCINTIEIPKISRINKIVNLPWASYGTQTYSDCPLSSRIFERQIFQIFFSFWIWMLYIQSPAASLEIIRLIFEAPRLTFSKIFKREFYKSPVFSNIDVI